MKAFVEEALHGITDSSRHHVTLFALAVSMHAKNVLELGVREGHTTLPLLEAVRLMDGRLTSVDIARNDSIPLHITNDSRWNYVIKDSISFLQELPAETIFDVVFIDDWHDGEHVANELRLLTPHVTPSSLVLLHDCMCRDTQPDYHIHRTTKGEFANGGPFAAVEKLDRNIWEFSTVPVNNGLTILRKKGIIRKF